MMGRLHAKDEDDGVTAAKDDATRGCRSPGRGSHAAEHPAFYTAVIRTSNMYPCPVVSGPLLVDGYCILLLLLPNTQRRDRCTAPDGL